MKGITRGLDVMARNYEKHRHHFYLLFFKSEIPSYIFTKSRMIILCLFFMAGRCFYFGQTAS